jgi:hypothetical protein
LISENESRQAEKGGSKQENKGGYVQSSLYLIGFIGLLAFRLIGIIKGLDLEENLGRILLVLNFLPFACGVCCLLYGFLNLSFRRRQHGFSHPSLAMITVRAAEERICAYDPLLGSLAAVSVKAAIRFWKPSI